MTDKARLVVVPSDPIASYEAAGITWLESYYNPQGAFDEVLALSPLEEGRRTAYGMTILGVPEAQFTDALRDVQPDVVRAYGGFWPADLVCRHRLPDVPVVVSVHDSSPESIHPSLRHADLVICLSDIVKRRVLALGVSSTRVRVLPNRIDRQVFKPIRDAAALQSVAEQFPPGRHVLHVGRKTEAKNIETLVQALSYLPADYMAILVGKGDTAPYTALAEELGVADRCFWVEAVPNAELPIWYSWCDCMCTPSRWEGFGIVFIEAAACGAPIVTSDIAPMNEYLTHSVSAHLIAEYENPEALARGIRRVCEDAAYRARIADGATRAAEPFDKDVIDAAEVDVYRQALALGRRGLSRELSWRAWRASGWVSQRAEAASQRLGGRVKRRVRRHLPFLVPIVRRFQHAWRARP